MQTTQKRALTKLKRAKTAMEAGAIVSRYYEIPDKADEQAYKRGRLAEQFNQTIHITINGASDPRQSAEEVRKVIRDENGAMTKNFRAQSR